jgi:hypothetical protein
MAVLSVSNEGLMLQFRFSTLFKKKNLEWSSCSLQIDYCATNMNYKTCCFVELSALENEGPFVLRPDIWMQVRHIDPIPASKIVMAVCPSKFVRA